MALACHQSARRAKHVPPRHFRYLSSATFLSHTVTIGTLGQHQCIPRHQHHRHGTGERRQPPPCTALEGEHRDDRREDCDEESDDEIRARVREPETREDRDGSEHRVADTDQSTRTVQTCVTAPSGDCTVDL